MTKPPHRTLDWKRLRFEQLEQRCAMAADLFAVDLLPAVTQPDASFDGHTYQRSHILLGSTITIDLPTELHLESSRITSITTEGVGELSVHDDRELVYQAPTSIHTTFERSESTVTLLDAANREYQVVVRLFVSRPADYAEEPVEVRLEAVDSDREKITQAGRGDEFYVVATVADQRADATGVFAAYLNISFDSHNLKVVGKPQSPEPYINGVRPRVTGDGILGAGGFAGPDTSLQAEPRALVKFLVRVTDDGPIQISARLSTAIGDELLLFGIDFPVRPSSFQNAQLEVASAPAAAHPDSQAESAPSSPADSAGPVSEAPDVAAIAEYVSDLYFLEALPAETVMTLSSDDQPTEPAWNVAAPQVFASAADQNFGQGGIDHWFGPKRRWRT